MVVRPQAPASSAWTGTMAKRRWRTCETASRSPAQAGTAPPPPRRNAEQHQAADVAGPEDPSGDRDRRDRAHAAEELPGRGRPPADPGSGQGNSVPSGDPRPEHAYEGR